ncbi:hypothetical protein [Clostridium sp. HBUAS56010]|uniref:hypothetical protein n=1 Tax=Clostridium sp. HBUAS56010 TaxID=2571127 RepID=UPI00163D8383|nr:hypothetical protein [Clostridium sp. HBUAS56010]
MIKFNKFCIIVFITLMSFEKLLYLPDTIERIETSVIFTIKDIAIEFHEVVE